ALRGGRHRPPALPHAVQEHAERAGGRVDQALRQRSHPRFLLVVIPVASPVEHLVQPGDFVVAGQVLGEPVELLERLFAGSAGGWRLFTGMSLTDVLTKAPPAVCLCSFVGLGAAAGLIASGRMELLPVHMSALPPLLTDGPLRPDVALVVVSPPDEDGLCHLGVQSDYIHAAAYAAR